MDDKTGALEKLKAIMAKAEQVDMSSVKIGDIIYVPLDEEDGLILKTDIKTVINILLLSALLRKVSLSVPYW